MEKALVSFWDCDTYGLLCPTGCLPNPVSFYETTATKQLLVCDQPTAMLSKYLYLSLAICAFMHVCSYVVCMCVCMCVRVFSVYHTEDDQIRTDPYFLLQPQFPHF